MEKDIKKKAIKREEKEKKKVPNGHFGFPYNILLPNALFFHFPHG